jgi:hypothetical protein
VQCSLACTEFRRWSARSNPWLFCRVNCLTGWFGPYSCKDRLPLLCSRLWRSWCLANGEPQCPCLLRLHPFVPLPPFGNPFDARERSTQPLLRNPGVQSGLRHSSRRALEHSFIGHGEKRTRHALIRAMQGRYKGCHQSLLFCCPADCFRIAFGSDLWATLF